MTDQPIVIIGAGLAGLQAAICLAPAPVLLVTAAPLEEEAASTWAQGGIAAAIAETDSATQHFQDTLMAGANLNNRTAVRVLVDGVRQEVESLIDMGIRFARNEDGAFDLVREGAHSHNRVLRAAAHDGFGREMMRVLVRRAKSLPSITIMEDHIATGLCVGDGQISGVSLAPRPHGPTEKAGAPFWQAARAIILATGGIGGLYNVTTNPMGAIGGGLVMAAQAGAAVSDMEFVQFHPTALDIGRDPAPLATEALRGAGAILLDGNGHRFMPAVHELAELAPRDIVARAIHRAKQETGAALLDPREAVGDKFPEQFPAIYDAAQSAHIDPVKEPLPVAPAAHFHMGGLTVDLDGRTSIPGLWAVGEVACTGVHGANRLASNSLAEGLVFGRRAARDIQNADLPTPPAPSGIPGGLAPKTPQSQALELHLRQMMSAHVGVVRDETGLQIMLDELNRLDHAPARHEPVSHPRLQTIRHAARLVTQAALERRNSIGGHFRSDYPTKASGQPTTARPANWTIASKKQIHSTH